MEGIPEGIRNRMLLSWEMFPEIPGLHIDDSGSRWPDLMDCGGGPPSFVSSQKILASLKSHGISLRRATPIPIGSIASKKLREVPPPDYFVIEALPGIQIDYAASGYAVAADGYPDAKTPRPTPRPVLQHDPATWSGADLFCSSNYFGRPRYLQLLCTERIREIAATDGWTNVHFQRVRVKGVNPFTGRPE